MLVDRNAPSHAGQKCALVVEVAPSAIAIELQEGLLNHVFGVMALSSTA